MFIVLKDRDDNCRSLALSLQVDALSICFAIQNSIRVVLVIGSLYLGNENGCITVRRNQIKVRYKLL